MEIKVSKNELYEKLRMVTRVVGSSKTLPIIENYLFKIRENELQIIGTDLSIMITANVELLQMFNTEDKAFSLIMDKTLFNALSEIPDQPLTIKINPDSLQVKVEYNNGHFDLQCKSSESFPFMEEKDSTGKLIQFEPKQIIDSFKMALPFTGNDELRPVLSGVFMDIKDSGVTFVATDANILAMRQILLEEPNNSEIIIKANIPAKAVKVIISILSEIQSNEVNLSVSEKNISLSTDKYSFVARLIDGNYPNYRGVIPQNHNTRVNLNTEDLRSAVKRVSVFSNSNTKLLKLDFNKDKLKINAEDIDFSVSATENLNISMDGDDITIGFKSIKLIDILNVVNSDECEFLLTDQNKAALVKPLNNPEITLLIMPMLISNN